VFCNFDACLAIYIERSETKQPRGVNRQADDVGILPRHLCHELCKGKLRYIPFAVERETRENLVMAKREPVRVDAFGPHRSQSEVTEMVVIGRGDGESNAH